MPPRPADGPWVEEWLSISRFSTYLTAASGRREVALDLYEWNCRTGGALLRDLAHLEVALRNSYNVAIQSRWTGDSHWLLAPDSPLRVAIFRSRRAGRGGKDRVDINGRSREVLNAAVSKARPGAPVGKVIAELPFGFWRYCTSAGHEKALWVPYLHHAFPAGTSRRDVDERLAHLNTLRNRIAHHEPLLRENLDTRHGEILDLCGMLNPTLARYLASTSTVPTILAARPANPATRAEPTGSEPAEELV